MALSHRIRESGGVVAECAAIECLHQLDVELLPLVKRHDNFAGNGAYKRSMASGW